MIVDRALVDRLETSAAIAAAALASALSHAVPETGAVAEPLGDGALVALGPGRYVNRAVGASLAPLAPESLVDALIAFFAPRGLAPSIEVCTWAPAALLDELGRRGFRPSWFRNVYARPAVVDADPEEHAGGPPASLVVRVVDESLVAAWAGVLADGNGIVDPAARAISDEFAAAAHSGPDRTDYLADVDGQPAGCGSLERVRGVGWVGAAATVPAFGGRGVQGALLRRRMADAAQAGCDLVAASALPGGRSARNLERHGFSQAYAQLVMTLA